MQSSAPQRARDVAFREIDGEMVLVSASAACSFSLNEVGSLVWKQLDGMRDVDEIAADVSRRFGISLEQALADVKAFLEEIAQEGLLAVGSREEL